MKIKLKKNKIKNTQNERIRIKNFQMMNNN